MKRIILILLSALLILSLAACSEESLPPSAGPTPEPVSEPPSATPEPAPEDTPAPPAEETVLLPDPVVVEKNGVRVAVEPALELIVVIQNFIDFHITSTYNFTYKEDIASYFSDMAGHEAVLFFNEHTTSLYQASGGPFHVSALMINPDFTLDQTAFDAYYSDRFPVDVNEFLSVMKAFYVDSGFEEFYLQHLDYYTSFVEHTAASFPDWEMIPAMEEFYGKGMESYNIVLCPNFWNGGFGPAIQRDAGLACYSIQGSAGAKEGLPTFGSTNDFADLVLHEFGHSFVSINSEAEAFPDILKARDESAYLQEPIQDKMQSQGYGEWHIACEELVLRAVVIRQMADNQGANAEGYLKSEISKGYIYIETVYDSLQTYVDNRDTYPTFDDFTPVLLNELMQAYPPA